MGYFARQFIKPTGMIGKIVGLLMTNSNKQLNRWAIDLLEIQPSDHILEIGFGSGVAIAMVEGELKDGSITGIDHSKVMFNQASKNNREAIRKGKVKLMLSSVEELPDFQHTFDKILTVNTILFWQDPIVRLKELRKQLKPGGKIAIALQHRAIKKEITENQKLEEVVHKYALQITRWLKEAGYKQVCFETKNIKPLPAVCILGVNGNNHRVTK